MQKKKNRRERERAGSFYPFDGVPPSLLHNTPPFFHGAGQPGVSTSSSYWNSDLSVKWKRRKKKQTRRGKERGEREEEGRGLATETRVGTSRWKSISKSPERERTTPTDAPPLPPSICEFNGSDLLNWVGAGVLSFFDFLIFHFAPNPPHPPPSTSKSIQMRFNVAAPLNNIIQMILHIPPEGKIAAVVIWRERQILQGRHDDDMPSSAQLSPVSSFFLLLHLFVLLTFVSQ